MASVKTPLSLVKNNQKSEAPNPMKSSNSQCCMKTDKGQSCKTRVVVCYDVGFNNSISIRGNGAGLSWDKGIVLRNIAPDQWVWETNAPFKSCEFKVLINDMQYEIGENHTLVCDKCIEYTPIFV